MRKVFQTILAAALFTGVGTYGADATLKTADQPAPKEVAESIRSVLEPKAIQLLQGDKPSLEIWFRREAPLKSKPATAAEALGAMTEAALVGVIAAHDGSLRDYKDNEVPKGIYTARFALQPKDGDHLGTSDFDFFLVLVAAENDKELNGLNTFRPLVKASGKSTSSGHPIVISLRPASAEGTIPRITEPTAEHKAVRVRMTGKATSGDKNDLVFDLVYRGHGHIQ